MMKKIGLIFIITLALFSCSEESGKLIFTANGEGFVADGFTSRDGWDINFDRVIVGLDDITAYNINDEGLFVELPGSFEVNLKESPIVTVGSVGEVRKGNYQSLKFTLNSILMEGVGEKDGEKVTFSIRLNEKLTFNGKDGYVGDSIKGLLTDDETTVEMTFHFDHIFGDIEADADDHINTGSPGFNIFYEHAFNGVINVDQSMLVSDNDYDKLIGAIETLGHLGEGHCEVER